MLVIFFFVLRWFVDDWVVFLVLCWHLFFVWLCLLFCFFWVFFVLVVLLRVVSLSSRVCCVFAFCCLLFFFCVLLLDCLVGVFGLRCLFFVVGFVVSLGCLVLLVFLVGCVVFLSGVLVLFGCCFGLFGVYVWCVGWLLFLLWLVVFCF